MATVDARPNCRYQCPHLQTPERHRDGGSFRRGGLRPGPPTLPLSPRPGNSQVDREAPGACAFPLTAYPPRASPQIRPPVSQVVRRRCCTHSIGSRNVPVQGRDAVLTRFVLVVGQPRRMVPSAEIKHGNQSTAIEHLSTAKGMGWAWIAAGRPLTTHTQPCQTSLASICSRSR